MKSVLQNEKLCYVCGTHLNLHCHHVFGGTANRKKSEKYGLKVWLCARHHNMSDEGVHFDPVLNRAIEINAQRYFEDHIGTHEEFMKEFGRNYL